MRLFDLNIPRTGGDNEWAGVYLFRLKELAVQAGYEVLASGDGGQRYAWRHITGPVQPAGSGGAYDCWVDGSIRNPNTPSIGGDATNASAWCILTDASNRMILLQQTNQTSSYSGYARIAVTHGGPGGGWAPDQSTGPSTIPPVPAGGASHEQWLCSSSRATASGAAVFLYNASGGIHLWADDSPGIDGGLPLGWVTINASGVLSSYLSVIPMIGETDPEDPDPAIYVHGLSADWGGSAFSPTNRGYRGLNISTHSSWTDATTLDAQGRAHIYPGVPIVSITGGAAWTKGIPHRTGVIRMRYNAGAWGHHGIDQNGDGWATFNTSPFRGAFPWDPSAGDPIPVLSAGAQDFFVQDVADFARAAAVPFRRHTNRAWDNTAGAFVRWVTAEPDPQGRQYPGPGTFGVDTINYCLESVT